MTRPGIELRSPGPLAKRCKNEQRERLSYYIQKQDIYDIPIYKTSCSTLKPHTCKFELNRINCEMEINTECSSSLISEKQFNEQPNARLSKKGVIQRLRTCSGEVIIPKREANLNVKYNGKINNLRVLVVPGSEPSLLGKDWLESLTIYVSATCNQIKRSYLNQGFSELFKPGLGTLKNVTAKLYIKQNSTLVL